MVQGEEEVEVERELRFRTSIKLLWVHVGPNMQAHILVHLRVFNMARVAEKYTILSPACTLVRK